MSFVDAIAEEPNITVDEASSANAKSVAFYLYRHCKQRHTNDLEAKPDQGKVACAMQQDRYGTGSSWMFDGRGVRFCDWRFIHRARTNTLPTNAAKSRWSATDLTCRRCRDPTKPDTLPHVICHCHPNMVSI